MARGIGRGMREIQNASNEIKRDIQNSVVDIKREANLNKALLEDDKVKESPKKDNTSNQATANIPEKEDEQVGEA